MAIDNSPLQRPVFLIVVLAFSLTACAQGLVPTPVPDEFRTALPAPTDEGVFEAVDAPPEGRFLFIAINESQICGAGCNCPAVEAVREPYEFYDGKLEIAWFGSQAGTELGWEALKRERGIIGIYTFYNLSNSDVQAFVSLPFTTPKGGFTVTGMDASGAIAVQMGYGRVRLEAGHSLNRQSVARQGECQILFTDKITNFGFLEDEQVVLR